MPSRRSKAKGDDDDTRSTGMRVYLVRHGIAINRDDPECPEEAKRYLTPKGVDRTRAAAGGLKELGVRPSVLLSSPYVRAVQTGKILCEVLGLDAKQIRTTDSLKPEADPAALAGEIERLSETEVMCFGHAPHLDEFIAYAARAGSAFTEMKKAGVACLEIDLFAPPRATLNWLLTPKALRHLGR